MRTASMSIKKGEITYREALTRYELPVLEHRFKC